MRLNWKKLLSNKTEFPRAVSRKNDKRSPFDSDYSRITFSAPFRRLQDKTQVFPLEQNDFVRTRLTHSIEVASIARSLGKSIFSNLDENNDKYGWKNEYYTYIPVILECAGLVHDIGNPPFGHSGEKAIQKWFDKQKKKLLAELEGFQPSNDSEANNKIKSSQRIQDFLNFDGNAQGFRVLTHLQCVCDYYGYHLTSALLTTIMKYPIDSITGNKKEFGDYKLKKFGYCDSEKKNAEFVLKQCGLINKRGEHFRHPLVFILEAADDIAYSAADIEDGIKKGLFSLDDLINELKKEKDDVCIKQVLEKYKIKIGKKKMLEERKNHCLRISIHQVYCDTIVEEFVSNYDKIMTGSFNAELLTSGKLKNLRNVLKKFSNDKIIDNCDVIKTEIAGEEIIGYYLSKFSDDLINNVLNKKFKKEEKVNIEKYIDELKLSKIWKIISDDFKDIFIHSIKEKAKRGIVYKKDIIYYTYLLIIDYISGMTDNYCVKLYRRLRGIDII